MNSNRWLTTLVIGTTTFFAGCKKSDAVPIVDVTPSPRQVEKKVQPSPSGKPAIVHAAPKTKPPREFVVAQAQVNKPEPPAEKSATQNDKGTKLLIELLRPSDAAVAKLSQGPKRLPGPAAIERPAPALPLFQGLPARYPSKQAGKTTPRDPSEGTPLARNREEPKGPEEIRFTILALERWPAPDTGEPVALPIMAQYVPDRASLVSPSTDSSRDAALAGTMPARTAPLPFARFNLPDPFENRTPLRTTAVDTEKTDPVVATPRPLVK